MATEERLLYPILDQKVEPRITANLILLVNEQKQALQNGEFIPESNKDRKSIFNWFTESERFKQIYKETVEFHRTPRTNEERAIDKREFGGAAYQYIAHCYLGARLPESAVLLSPKRTHEFYSNLFPNKENIEHSYGLDSLENVSVPDGIILKEYRDRIQIIRVCEYSLVDSRTNFESKYKAFSIDKENISLLDHASLLFILPSPFKTPWLQMADRSKITILRTPFNNKQFGRFIDRIYPKK